MGRAQGQPHFTQGVRAGARGPRGPYKWSDDRIESELASFVGDRQDWPTADEFRAADQGQLLDAVMRNGGVNRWALALARPLRARQDRTPLTDEQARAGAEALIATHGRLPGSKKLARLGEARLAWVVEQAGGAKAFCRQHNLT